MSATFWPRAATEAAVKTLPQPTPATAPPNLDTPSSGIGDWIADNVKSIPDLPMALAQGLGGSFNRAAKAVNLAVGGLPTLYDKAASLITGQNTTAEAMLILKTL